MIVVDQSASLEASTLDAARLIERAARTCYKSESRIGPGSAAKLIRHVIQRGHMSVIEHASATFRLVTDRGVTHELVRHRLAAYSQESTRYCNYAKADAEGGGQIQFIRPVNGNGNPALTGAEWLLWQSAMKRAESVYLEAIERGMTPQLARSVLPNSLKTEIVMTANFREWLHVIKLRTSPAAHPQMRHLIGMVAKVLVDVCPEVFGAEDVTVTGEIAS